MRTLFIFGLVFLGSISCAGQKKPKKNSPKSDDFARLMLINIIEISDSLFTRSQEQSKDHLLPTSQTCSESGNTTVGYGTSNETLTSMFYSFSECHSVATKVDSYDLKLTGELGGTVSPEGLRHFVGELKFEGVFNNLKERIDRTCPVEWWIDKVGVSGSVCDEKFTRNMSDVTANIPAINDQKNFLNSVKNEAGICRLSNNYCDTNPDADFSAVSYHSFEDGLISIGIGEVKQGQFLTNALSKISYDIVDYAYDEAGRNLYVSRGKKGVWILPQDSNDFVQLTSTEGLNPIYVASIAWNSIKSELILYEVIEGVNRALKYKDGKFLELETAEFNSYEEDIEFDSNAAHFFALESDGAERSLVELKKYTSEGVLANSVALTPKIILVDDGFEGKVQIRSKNGNVFLAVSTKSKNVFYQVNLDSGLLTEVVSAAGE